MNKRNTFLFKNINIIILIILFTSNPFLQISTFENINSQKNAAFSIIKNDNFNSQKIEYKYSYTSEKSIKSIIVILINFIDKINSKPIDYIKDLVFNKVNEYYLEVSYGLFSFYGNITSKWYMLNNPIKYYGSGNFTEEKHNELIEDAIRIADIDIDYKKYDAAIIVHSGDNQAYSGNEDDIWSCGYTSPYILQTNEGRIPLSICVVSENDPLGVFAHEVAHMLGLPDLYSRKYGDVFLGKWDLMSSGLWNNLGETPSHLNSWCKIKLGWISSNRIKEIHSGEIASVLINPLEKIDEGFLAIKIPISQKNYYLIELRKKIGFDSYLPNEGILILFIDESKEFEEGAIKIIDANPLTETLDDASFKIGQEFNDKINGLKIKIVSIKDSSYELRIEYKVVDLSITDFSIYPLNAHAGTIIKFNITIANLGMGDAEDFSMKVYIDDELFFSKILSLKIGDSIKFYLNWIAIDGKHIIKCIIDEEGEIPEISKDNNILTKEIIIGYTLTIQTPFNGIDVEVDDVRYKTNFKGNVEIFVAPGKHNIKIQESFYEGENIRHLFIKWSDGEDKISREIIVDKDTIIYAIYKTQYFLKVISPYSEVIGSGWYNKFEKVFVKINSTIVYINKNIRKVFKNWSGDASGSESTSSIIFMNSPKVVFANWKTQYYLNISSIYYDPKLNGWYDEGEVIEVSIPQIIDYNNGTRRKFIEWYGSIFSKSNNITIEMDSPKEIFAKWITQYKISIIFLDNYEGRIYPLPSYIIAIHHIPEKDFKEAYYLYSYDDIWINEGNWTIYEIRWNGINIVSEQYPSNIINSPKEWYIKCKVYNFNIKVKDIFNLPAPKIPIMIEFPNGTSIIIETNVNGLAYIQSAPYGKYLFKISYLNQIFSEIRIIDEGIDLIEMRIFFSKITIIAIILILIPLTLLILMIFLKRKRKAKFSFRIFPFF
ncbi:MAG: M6 family metalloprotease domain-containing protein [Nitrososphaerota archaeon]